ncbi:MAG: phage holin family protein [Candidatus Omnitrophica bacterium]|nr:phage holin family protein [Candidatus Omnitrophota bacterium]
MKKSIFLTWLVSTVSLLLAIQIIPGLKINSWVSLLGAALVISLLNWFLRPVLFILTLPINILTLGLFNLFLNSLIFLLTGYLVKGFIISHYWSAFWGALLFSFASIVLNALLGTYRMKIVSSPCPQKDKVIETDDYTITRP